MRVITGEAKGRKLKGPPSTATRPMQDKIKEALFSALESLDLDIARVLDLYAGTGGIGIEALSRGAEWADFVDQQKCGLRGRALEPRSHRVHGPERGLSDAGPGVSAPQGAAI